MTQQEFVDAYGSRCPNTVTASEGAEVSGAVGRILDTARRALGLRRRSTAVDSALRGFIEAYGGDTPERASTELARCEDTHDYYVKLVSQVVDALTDPANSKLF